MRNAYRFFAGTITWTVILVSTPVASQLIVALREGSTWELVELLYQVPAWTGLFLPFAAFAGGLSIAMHVPVWRVCLYGLPMAALAYILTAYVAPLAEHEVKGENDMEVSPTGPTGPWTPSALRDLRARVEVDPPSAYGYSIENPQILPPNLLSYLIHSKIVLALFAVFAGLLGRMGAFLTGDLSPPTRRNARWAMGLLIAILFFLANVVGEEWVRSNPTRHSGVLGSWVSLVVPLAMLGILHRMVQRRNRRLEAMDPPRV